MVVLLVAAGFGAFAFFQNRALPGTTLWGHDVAGKTQQQIATMIDDQANATKVPVAYGDKTAEVSAKDLGVSVDAQAIAHDAVDAKRNAPCGTVTRSGTRKTWPLPSTWHRPIPPCSMNIWAPTASSQSMRS